MIGTNRDLAAIQQLLDREILMLKTMASGGVEDVWLDRRLISLCRQRIAICAALVNRRREASNKVVVFARWVSGNGALGGAEAGCNRQTTPLGEDRLDKAHSDLSWSHRSGQVEQRHRRLPMSKPH